MSVINKMLQDLEQRQQGENSAEKAPASQFVRPQVAFNSQVTQSKKSRLGLFALALTIPMVWIGYSLLQQVNQLEDTVKAASEIPEKDTNELVAPSLASTVSSTIKADNHAVEDMSPKRDMSDQQLTELALSTAFAAVSINPSVAPEISHQQSIAQQDVDAVIVEQDALASQLTSQSTSVDRQDTTNSVASLDVTPTDAVSRVNEVSTVSGSAQQDPATQRKPQQMANVDKPTSQQAVVSNMKVTEVTLTKAQLAKVLFQKAQAAEKEKRLDDASGWYLEAIILDPSLHAARSQLVGIYYAQNNANTAIRLLESGVGMFPTHWEFYLIKANIESALQEYRSALQSLSYIDDNSNFAKDKWAFQGEVAQKVGQYNVAESAYRSLLTLESTQAKWWMGLAYALDSQQQYVKAAEAYRSALDYPGLSSTAIEFVEQRLAQLGENQ